MVLDNRVAEELKELYKSLEDQGKLLSREQLAEYYGTFSSRFGPDKLKNLDGEALLNIMHDIQNRDSLVYWLEFKDDEEFPSPTFGSIAGGSAFKLGLFRKKETGLWTTGSSQNPKELSIEQAIDKARQHRDQLIKGIELLEKMPTNGTGEDYQQLQQEMDRVVPDISDSSWGHKYFSLLYPEKLDDFHNPDFQRFHLIKLLQLPPQGEGRYIAGGRFVAIANTLNMPINHLILVLKFRDGWTQKSYWRIGTSAGTAPRDRWELMREGNCVAIGWDIGDLMEITNDKKGREQIYQLLLTRYPDRNHSSAGRAAQQIFNFRWAITENDLVLASDGASVLGIGRVTDDYDYKYDPSSDFPYRRPVEWLSLDEWQQPDQQPDVEGKLTTVYKMKRDRNLLEAEKHIYGKEPIISTVPTIQSVVSATLHPSLTPPRLVGIPARIQAILERKGQVILYGPPGTGKTYWAENAARELAARSNFNRTFEQLTDEQRALVLGDGDQPGGIVRMCSFHPAYGYEDFLEGFRPEPVNGQMHFILRDGIFKKLCNDAETQPDHKFYLIIDEINRGDIPRIFGELLTVLEKDKRGTAILLPLTGSLFRVPDNVYIIGTMNTADRSIALLDTALRRRFGFIELMPDISILGDTMVAEIPLGSWLKALNERICEYVGRDARNLQIGHSYLLEKGRPAGDFATFAKILREDILPLLEEYCYEDYATLEKILGSSLIDGQKQQVRQELFDPSNRSLLVQALLAPTPDMITSTQALTSAAQAVDEEGEENGEDTADDQP
ncbi:MAG TPA: AAA family ATPase [Ktedonobacteraceae bacterium]|nr:AAA family ATPase [Ktedonobacteraceae bacterium]